MAKKFNYNWKEFTLRAAYKGTPEKMFKMWTDPKQLCKWFLTDADIELKKGGKYMFKWAMGAVESGRVLAVRKSSLFRFTFSGCKVEVKFSKAGKECIVTLRQYDIPAGEKYKVGTHMNCQLGWTFFFTNLKSVLVTGRDLREFNPKHLKEGTVFY